MIQPIYKNLNAIQHHQKSLDCLKLHIKHYGNVDIDRSKYDWLHKWVILKRNKKDKISKNDLKIFQQIPCFQQESRGIKTFEQTFEELKNYIAKSGGVYPTSGTLYRWIVVNRSHYNTKKLSQERIDKLNGIENWVWKSDRKTEEKSKAKLVKLKNWIEKYNKTPSSKSKETVEHKFGEYCTTLRQRYKLNKSANLQLKDSGGRSRLEDYQINFLNDIPQWYWNTTQLYQNKIDQYIKITQLNKKPPCFLSKDPNEKKIAQWAIYQRIGKRLGDLSKDQINSLEKIDGWKWVESNDSFVYYCGKLISFIKLNNRMPLKTDKNEVKLACWCKINKNKFRYNKLSDDRIAMLNLIPSWTWDVITERYANKFKLVKQWFDKYRKLPSSEHNISHNEEEILGRWCVNQRLSYNAGLLHKQKITLCESIPRWNWTIEDYLNNKWIFRYNQLQEYTKKYKKLPSSRCGKSEATLSTFCCRMRSQKKIGKLSSERIKLLEQISVWKWVLPNTYRQSGIALEYLNIMKKFYYPRLKTSQSECGEFRIQGKTKNSKYSCDGYDEETKTVIEFQGCFYHGCKLCFEDKDAIFL